ncbi:thioesterase-like superfamily-domain-containing protein [Zychaea mexicana]|uniref:thioesterase-like superfamily-domain-containing protein n=1 Tax=Zychaea mexicana TaxID=64656 RepID=UPI0022FEB265|nr:thioesterase-like superfamily-domain-containing protein [Zychaea mexicana]KAI9498465.1 thioesterase-like superfamily-domain-containing protein [Zychaea mexicana]
MTNPTSATTATAAAVEVTDISDEQLHTSAEAAMTTTPADQEHQMVRALTVEELDTDLYRSHELWHPHGSRGAFGGQLVAQALRAAWNTVPEEFHVHSLHNYFLVPGRSDIPAIYQVRRVRDGRSFATRVVTCTQQGKIVIVCTCSFTKFDATSETLHHQTPMPDNVPRPDELPNNNERMKMLLEDPRIPDDYRERFKNFMDAVTPVEYRDIKVDSVEEFARGRIEPSERQGQWFKVRDRLPDNDAALHACTIAYASDSGILMTAVRANGMMARKGIGMMASVDHSMWFHAPTRADEWLYYDLHSPRSNEGRGTAFGRIYNEQGVLVATTSQEGIIRLTKGEQERRRKNLNKL